MSYSDIYLKKNAKIPTLLGILIACFIGLFFLRLFTQTVIPSKAAKKTVRRVEITNLSSNQVTIYWQTDQKTIGWIIYGENENGLNMLGYDERNITQDKIPYIHHYVTLKNLNENKAYFFKLVNNNKFEDNNNIPFTFKTPLSIKDFKSNEPAYGKIILSNGTPLENAVILLNVRNSFPLATLSKITGEWLIPLNTFYDKNTYQLISPLPNDKITIEFLSEDQKSQAITNFSKTSPLPGIVVMGKSYDFTAPDNVLGATTSNTNSESTTKEIDIAFPKENALIPGYNPLIKGVALPNAEILISVHSDTVFTSRIKADNKGLWSLNLPSSLSPGDHTITIQTVDKNGNPVTIVRKFIIAKNGEQVLGLATPEGTVTPEVPTDTLIPLTSSPTAKLTSTPPVSGGNIYVSLAGSLSFIVIGIGLMLVF